MLKAINPLTHIAIVFVLMLSASASAQEPVYSLDTLADHPYRYMPAYGHASQNPGSPKWFVPGYGYRIPGFGYHRSQPQFDNFYHKTIPHSLSTNGRLYWEIGRSPWYFPGAPEPAPFPLHSMGW
ncbi:MAG: hypothetical protein R3C01_12625 [Planctomycetaceae bacterium]